jgi:hypothetical protein
VRNKCEERQVGGLSSQLVRSSFASKDGNPFTLLDGESFTAWGVSATAFITPQAGQLFIKPGQTVNIVLRRDVLGK